MGCEFIFTCQHDSEQLCVNEMKNINKDVKLLKWLDGGVGIARHEKDFLYISRILKEAKPVFLRHIFPVEFIFGYNNILENSGFDAIINKYKSQIAQNTALSVQVRSKTGGKAYNLKEIKNYISEKFEKLENINELNSGYISNPQKIISVFISEDIIYAGISDAVNNLSSWSGGMRHYALNESVISRAEFKLLELFEYFPELVNLNNNKNKQEKLTALDLGASPGGWTKILIEKGYKVTAVDPNKLSDVLNDNPDVEYYKCLTEDFFAKNIKKRGSFDLITNDMRMHSVQSAKIMAEACGFLKDGGYLIMTLKLNKSGKTDLIRKTLNILKDKYEALFLKQLFHNRSEVTAVMRKK